MADQLQSRGRKHAGPRYAAVMDCPLAYLITWTPRGTWVAGDERGSADLEHNRHGTPYLEPNRARASANNEQRLRESAVLSDDERAIASRAIREACTHREWRLLALCVRTNHVHVVVSADAGPEKVMQDLKSWATRGIRETSADREAGLWTRHGSTRYLWDHPSVDGAIRYVEAHANRGPRAYARGSDGACNA